MIRLAAWPGSARRGGRRTEPAGLRWQDRSRVGGRDMEILFAVALMAGLFLPIELLRFPPSRLSWVPDRVSHLELVGDTRQPGAAEDGPGEPVEMTVQLGLFTSTHIQRRLHA